MPTTSPSSFGADLESLKQLVDKQERMRPSEIIEEAVLATTTYVINPYWLPREYADLTSLVKELDEKLGLEVDDTEIKPFLAKAGNISGISPYDALRILLDQNKTLAFKNGMLRFDNPVRTTPIPRVYFTTEKVSVTVVGSTTEAEWIAQKVVEELWFACGRQRAWNEIQSDAGSVQMVGYQTVTRAHLGVNLEDLFSTNFRKFLDEVVEDPGSLGKAMGLHTLDKTLQLSERQEAVLVVPQIHRIEIRVTVFNKLTGRYEDCDLSFDVSARNAMHQGVVTVSSELNDVNHTKLLNHLRSYVIASAGHAVVQS